MTDDGILIIEDISDISWIEELKNAVPDNLHQGRFQTPTLSSKTI